MAAPPILSWEGLGLIQGSGWLFTGLDLHIGPRDRLALIGRNGAGKTTLLKMIDDRIEADRGERKVKPGTRIVMLGDGGLVADGAPAEVLTPERLAHVFHITAWYRDTEDGPIYQPLEVIR